VRFYGCRMRVGRGLLAVVSGSLLGLAACSGGGDDPVVLPTGTSQPTTTASETDPMPDPTSSTEPTPTTTLVLPDEHVPEVDAFVQGFFDAYNAAQDSGDFSVFDAMYLPQCAGCLQMRDELEGWLADGGVVEGADWIILKQSSSAIADNYNAIIVAYRTTGSLTSIAGTIEPVEQSQAEPITLFLTSTPALTVADLGLGDTS